MTWEEWCRKLLNEQIYVLAALAMRKEQEISLPGGQTQPSVQWSSQSADRSGLLHVSEQGEPHSWYCMLKGHNLAEIRKNIILQSFHLECWEDSICNLGCFLSRHNGEFWSKWRLQHFRLSDICWKPLVIQNPQIFQMPKVLSMLTLKLISWRWHAPLHGCLPRGKKEKVTYLKFPRYG